MDKLENENVPFILTIPLHWTHFQTSSPCVFKTLAPLLAFLCSTATIIFWKHILEYFSSQIKVLQWLPFHLKLDSRSLLWPTQLCLPLKCIRCPDCLPHLTLPIFFLTLSWTHNILFVTLDLAHPGSRILVSGIYTSFYTSTCEGEGRGDLAVTSCF